MKIAHTLATAVLGLAAVGIVSSLPAHAETQPVHREASESTHEVADWMNRVCPTVDSVNCYMPEGTIHPKQAAMFIRVMPGRAHMVCVMYPDHPRHDYCA